MRRALLLTLLLASATFAAYPNLALWYRAQDTTGTTTTVDCSGNGRNGTINGSKVCATARGQQCWRFDGTGDYVATPSFGLSGTVVVFAADVRCKLYASGAQSIIGDAAQSGATGHIWAYRPANTNNLKWSYSNGAVGEQTITDYFAAPFDDVWFHMMFVADYTGKLTYFYRKGAPFGSPIAMAGTPLFPSTARVKYLGCYTTAAHLLTDGYLANVQLWTLATMPPLAVLNASAARIAAGGMPCW
jgi:hypothetical protein